MEFRLIVQPESGVVEFVTQSSQRLLMLTVVLGKRGVFLHAVGDGQRLRGPGGRDGEHRDQDNRKNNPCFHGFNMLPQANQFLTNCHCWNAPYFVCKRQSTPAKTAETAIWFLA